MYRFLDTKQSTINKKNNILIVNTFFQSFMLQCKSDECLQHFNY